MRVLIVEDEPDLLSALLQSVREAGYAADPAADGKEALTKIRQAEYDAVILDLMIPRIDGFKVLQQLRTDNIKVGVLVLTARDALPDRVRGLDLGADDYLTKPFELAELLARLRSVIRRSAGKASSILQLQDVVLDMARKTITKAGQSVALTAREFGLLEFLALRRGELVTRTMLYEHLFDEDDDSLSNLIDVHVSNIRKKLGKDLIVTRRGLGYIIEDQSMTLQGSDAPGPSDV